MAIKFGLNNHYVHRHVMDMIIDRCQNNMASKITVSHEVDHMAMMNNETSFNPYNPYHCFIITFVEMDYRAILRLSYNVDALLKDNYLMKELEFEIDHRCDVLCREVRESRIKALQRGDVIGYRPRNSYYQDDSFPVQKTKTQNKTVDKKEQPSSYRKELQQQINAWLK